MSDDYTPTTDEMRFAWADRVNKHDQEGAEEFDRWLAKVCEAAWDEGYTRGNAHNGRRDDCPYRAAEIREKGQGE